ncbi:MAG: hypothetical protein KatS3mg038_2171 [Candidatus Kapaibacterium sp.]|nr:MAG: hypothetical protein KatS3mg038_2171 [Candidatus Kapabacteria bacterium]
MKFTISFEYGYIRICSQLTNKTDWRKIRVCQIRANGTSVEYTFTPRKDMPDLSISVPERDVCVVYRTSKRINDEQGSC